MRLVFTSRQFVISFLGMVFLLGAPVIALGADTYTPLSGAWLSRLGVDDFGQFFTGLFRIALIVSSVLAVLIIASAGIQYMTTDAIYGKVQSRGRIVNATLGLLMLLGIWIFFNEINPNILKLNLELKPTQVNITNTPQTRNTITPPQVQSNIGSTNSGTWSALVNERNGICGRSASGWRCGYDSIEACQNNLFSDSECAEFTVNGNATSFSYECTSTNSTNCLSRTDDYTYHSDRRFRDSSGTIQREITFYRSKQNCIAVTKNANDCSVRSYTDDYWNRQLSQPNTRMLLQ